jgi:hypothetical protein
LVGEGSDPLRSGPDNIFQASALAFSNKQMIMSMITVYSLIFQEAKSGEQWYKQCLVMNKNCFFLNNEHLSAVFRKGKGDKSNLEK